MENLVEIYKGKRVFLTGHTGFKGAWLLKWLHILGAKVKGYSLAPEMENCIYNTIDGNSICQSIISDIRNAENLKNEILSFEPDIIFHLAAQPLVRMSYDIPIETFDTNVMGTIHVLDAMRHLKKKCVGVMITTDKVYENKEWHYPYRESDRLGGYDPYSASKAAAEIAIQSYRSSFFNNKHYTTHLQSIASARAGNVIGGGDWAKDRIIPDIVRALNEEKEIIVRNPKAIRPWQHVLEPLSGYLTLGAKMFQNPTQFNESWNFGPMQEDTYTVEDLVNKSIEIWGKGTYKSPNQINAPHEAGLLKLDISKSINELQWKPRLNSQQAIEWTLEFYKSNNQKEYILNQIEAYQKL